MRKIGFLVKLHKEKKLHGLMVERIFLKKHKIKHVWFDLDGTLVKRSDAFTKAHAQLRYETYAKAVGKPLTEKLKTEFEGLYAKQGSNSAVFRSLGFPSDFWQKCFSQLDKSRYYKPVKAVTLTLKRLKDKVPISLFTNLRSEGVDKTLQLIDIDKAWFTFIVTGDDIQERKPAQDGFYEMIKRSQVPAEEILYVGDRVTVDILPAKKVGMKTCLVWSISDQADYSFKNFEDLLSLFK
ncbi:HAD family hydrolase [Candidatus Woesearchaeota archaeon]|nr:HAD family hydrolase [Candidatus Woesearchaeota archaeon]